MLIIICSGFFKLLVYLLSWKLYRRLLTLECMGTVRAIEVIKSPQCVINLSFALRRWLDKLFDRRLKGLYSDGMEVLGWALSKTKARFGTFSGCVVISSQVCIIFTHYSIDEGLLRAFFIVWQTILGGFNRRYGTLWTSNFAIGSSLGHYFYLDRRDGLSQWVRKETSLIISAASHFKSILF